MSWLQQKQSRLKCKVGWPLLWENRITNQKHWSTSGQAMGWWNLQCLSSSIQCISFIKGQQQKYSCWRTWSCKWIPMHASSMAPSWGGSLAGKTTQRNNQSVLILGMMQRSINLSITNLFVQRKLLVWRVERCPHLPPMYSNHKLVRNTLELCQYVMLEEEQQSFRTQQLDKEHLMTAAVKIESTAFRKWEFEGITNIENSQGKKPFYFAAGKCIRQYKQ